jgi:hypothetical protein
MLGSRWLALDIGLSMFETHRKKNTEDAAGRRMKTAIVSDLRIQVTPRNGDSSPDKKLLPFRLIPHRHRA